MTVLLIDIGNTRVKWARLRDGRMGKQHAAANAGWTVKDFARVIGGGWKGSARGGFAAGAGVGGAAVRMQRGGPGVRKKNGRALAHRIIVSSVAGAKVDRMLIAAARRAGAPSPEFVTSQRSAGGVTTAYLEPWRLGVDRLVGAIGAHHLADGKAVCVVNVGTAVTIDLVDATGRHRGGAIVPGPALMVDSLLRHTSGIRRRAQGGRIGARGLFARTTRAAIGQGSLYAAASVIDRAIVEAHKALGTPPLVLLTGGASASVNPLITRKSVTVPDLVLHGLAVWSRHPPLKGRRLN